MNRLRPRQPYQTVPSSDSILHYDQGAGIELQPQSGSASSKSLHTSSYKPLNDTTSRSPTAFAPGWFNGWRVGTLWAASVVTISLIINVAVAVWLSTSAHFEDGLAELARGDCGRIETTDTIVHLAINVLSTLILSGSNYAMQVLVGPSRQEVDKAHQKGKWLDIGVPSLRNLTHISRTRACLWCILCLSSLPVHLMFNSAFYSALATNDYDVFITTESFTSGANFTPSDTGLVNLGLLQQNIGNLENLTNADCIRAYAQDLITDRRNLIIVSSNESTSNALLHTTSYTFSSAIVLMDANYNPYAWICSDPATYAYAQDHGAASDDTRTECQPYISYPIEHASEWAPYGFPAMYCLSEKVSEQCSFNANLPIIVTVIACNIIKAVVMIFIVFSQRSDPILVVGDAIASFLTIPDETTKHMCLLTREDADPFNIYDQRWPSEKRQKRGFPPLPQKTADSKREAWANAPSGRRWTTTIVIIGACISVTVGLLIAAVKAIPNVSATAIRTLGFGKVSGQALITGDGWAPNNIKSASGQVLASILIANIPQLVLSLLYFNVNGLLTVMLMAHEWSQLATQRKMLRVSQPRGDQRSTYFLQLPYRFAIPLLILSTLLHWLISRSIFLAVISEWDAGGNLTSATQIATCGFSPLPIILTLCLGIVIFVGLVGIGRRRYNPFVPLVASCSAAIAAACHAPPEEDDIALKPVQWGVVDSIGLWSDEPSGTESIGHCCFSSQDVTMPEQDKVYAGLSLELT